MCKGKMTDAKEYGKIIHHAFLICEKINENIFSAFTYDAPSFRAKFASKIRDLIHETMGFPCFIKVWMHLLCRESFQNAGVALAYASRT